MVNICAPAVGMRFNSPELSDTLVRLDLVLLVDRVIIFMV
jgi:hypothetical protein